MIEIGMAALAIIMSFVGAFSLYKAWRTFSSVQKLVADKQIEFEKAPAESCSLFSPRQENMIFGFLEAAETRKIITEASLERMEESVREDYGWLNEQFQRGIEKLRSANQEEVLIGLEKIDAWGDERCLPELERVLSHWEEDKRLSEEIRSTRTRLLSFKGPIIGRIGTEVE